MHFFPRMTNIWIDSIIDVSEQTTIIRKKSGHAEFTLKTRDKLVLDTKGIFFRNMKNSIFIDTYKIQIKFKIIRFNLFECSHYRIKVKAQIWSGLIYYFIYDSENIAIRDQFVRHVRRMQVLQLSYYRIEFELIGENQNKAFSARRLSAKANRCNLSGVCCLLFTSSWDHHKKM